MGVRMCFGRISIPLVLIGAATFLSGCVHENEPTQRGSQADTNRIISLCGGGLSNSARVELAAAYERSGGNVSAGYDSSARAIIFADDSINSADKVKMYKMHLGCVRELRPEG